VFFFFFKISGMESIEPKTTQLLNPTKEDDSLLTNSFRKSQAREVTTEWLPDNY